MTQVIGVSDGRRVAVDCCGDPKGFPVFLLHGTPGSRNGPLPRAPLMYQLGIRLISYDRPGYGDSSRQKGRAVADAALDVLDIADRLELKEFSIVGRSGGGPHALACAALIEDKRLQSVAVLVLEIALRRRRFPRRKVGLPSRTMQSAAAFRLQALSAAGFTRRRIGIAFESDPARPRSIERGVLIARGFGTHCPVQLA